MQVLTSVLMGTLGNRVAGSLDDPHLGPFTQLIGGDYQPDTMWV